MASGTAAQEVKVYGYKWDVTGYSRPSALCVLSEPCLKRTPFMKQREQWILVPTRGGYGG